MERIQINGFLDIHSASWAINLPEAWLDMIITGRVVVAREFIVGGMNGKGPMSFTKIVGH